MSIHNGLTCEGADTFLRHATDELKRIRDERDILGATIKRAREMMKVPEGQLLEEAIKNLELEVKHWRVEWKIDRDSYEAAQRQVNRLEYLLSDAYEEIRKQVAGSKVVFDSETVELAQKAEVKE